MATTTEKQTTRQESDDATKRTIAALQKAYSMEMQTVANYLADSVNLDGVRAEEVKNSLSGDIQEELGHAEKIARRLKQLGGLVPGPGELDMGHTHMDSLDQSTDVEHVIRAVIKDETDAINHYKQIIRDTDGIDFVTQDLCIALLADEEEHLTQFDGFLKEYTGSSNG